MTNSSSYGLATPVSSDALTADLRAGGFHSDAIDLSWMGASISSGRRLILAIAGVAVLCGATYAFLAPSVYQADILIKVADGDPSRAPSSSNLPGIFDLKTPSVAELEILRSRSVVERAVDRAGLTIDVQPRRLPVIGRWMSARSEGLSKPGLLGFGGYLWGNENAKVAEFEVPEAWRGRAFLLRALGDQQYEISLPGTDFKAQGKVGSSLRVPAAAGDVVLNVSNLSSNAGGEFWLRRHSREAAVESLQKSLIVEERGKQSGVISVGLKGYDPANLARVLSQVADQYIELNIESKTEEAARSLAFLDDQLPRLKARLEESEARYTQFRNTRGTIDLGEEVKSILQQTVQAQLRLVELRQRREELLTLYQESNPLVQAVTQQIKTVTAESDALNGRIKRIPGTEQDVNRLARDVRVNTDLYASLLNTAQQLSLVKASRVGSAKLIDSAVAPSLPVGPNRLAIIAAALLGGTLLGVFAALARSALRSGLQNSDDIERKLGLVVAAVVPLSARKADNSGLLVNAFSRESALEGLRSLRAALPFQLAHARNNIVAITSAVDGDGKAFIAANLAALLGASGKRVLLIDACTTRGHLAGLLDLGPSNGLAEHLLQKMPADGLLHRNVAPQMDFMSPGQTGAGTENMLAHEAFHELLDSMAAAYDVVLVVTGPLLDDADAITVCALAGTTLLVARHAKTTAKQLRDVTRRFARSGISLPLLVFNAAPTSNSQATTLPVQVDAS